MTLSANTKRFLVLGVLFALLAGRCVWNFDFGFQADSESLVVGEILYVEQNDTFPEYGLQSYGTEGRSSVDIRDDLLHGLQVEKIENFSDYKSQIGLQGIVFASMCEALPIVPLRWKLVLLRAGCGLLLAIVLFAIAILIGRKYNRTLAMAFYVTALLSPWLLSFSSNLYWVAFLWFVPMLISLWISLDYDSAPRRWACLAITVVVAIKCACGYEYISTIMMAMALFPIVDLITGDRASRLKTFTALMEMGIAALAGFAIALTIHAQMRGAGNIADGLMSIWQEDVLRRTLGGDTVHFDESLRASLEASIPETISKYLVFRTNIIEGVAGLFFIPFAAIATAILWSRRKTNGCSWELPFLIVALLATVSWLALAKSHSYIHTHMNYVLWYFGFVQICVYAYLKKAAELATNHVLRQGPNAK